MPATKLMSPTATRPPATQHIFAHAPLESRSLSDEAARLLALLQRRAVLPRPIGAEPSKLTHDALVIALGFGYLRGEMGRRRVRQAVDELRAAGIPVASDFCGYWLTTREEQDRLAAFMVRLNGGAA